MKCPICGEDEGHCFRCHHVHRMLERWPLWMRDYKELKRANDPKRIPGRLVEEARVEASRDLAGEPLWQ